MSVEKITECEHFVTEVEGRPGPNVQMELDEDQQSNGSDFPAKCPCVQESNRTHETVCVAIEGNPKDGKFYNNFSLRPVKPKNRKCLYSENNELVYTPQKPRNSLI